MRRFQELTITLDARGTDAREVFAELFAQAKVNFVLQIDIQRPVYLTLRETPFLRALQLLCEATNTRYSVRDGVYYVAPVGKASPAPPPPTVQVQETRTRTIRLVGAGLTLRAAVAEIAKQAGVKVEVAPDAPNLRYNLNLPSVELERALDALCEGVGLRWEPIDGGYRLAPLSPPQARPAQASVEQMPTAPSAPAANPRTAPSRPVSPENALRCPKCRYALQLEWRYCPICGAYVKHITDKAKREQGKKP
ncbi:MAG: hypothetical protein KatS3mg020_0679 [Fimbriimonadales bacterium]|nr:MAG: hypothetical protein KatS3mg020_0679 [Fimbriimonadales bacterium]